MTRFRTILSAAVLAVAALAFGGGASYAMGVPGGAAKTPGAGDAADGLVQKSHYFHCHWRHGHRHWRACRHWDGPRYGRNWRWDRRWGHRRWDRRRWGHRRWDRGHRRDWDRGNRRGWRRHSGGY